MNSSQNALNVNTAISESAVHTAAPVASEQAELGQWLSDRVAQNTEDLVAKIRKEAELESARLIRAVNLRTQEFVSMAQRQVEAAGKLEQSPSVKAQEDIGKHAMGAVTKILAELLSSLDCLAEKARALVVMNAKALEDLRAATTTAADEVASEVRVAPEAAEANEDVSQLHPELKDAGRSVDTLQSEPSPPEPSGKPAVVAEGEPKAAPEPKISQEDLELFYGEVKIDIAPPVNAMRFLGLMRGLQNTRGIRILGTSGSLNSGSEIAMSLEKPLPLLSLLRDMPFVEADGVKAKDRPTPSSAPGQSEVRRVSVAMRDAKCVRSEGSAASGRSAS